MTIQGTVTHYDRQHRSGIIHCDDDDRDIRVCADDLDASNLDHLTKHCRVVFEEVRREDGHRHPRRITQLQNPALAHHRSSFRRLRRAGRKSVY